MISTPLPKRGDSDTKTKKKPGLLVYSKGVTQESNYHWAPRPEKFHQKWMLCLLRSQKGSCSLRSTRQPDALQSLAHLLGLSFAQHLFSQTCHYVHYIHSALLLCPFKFRWAVHILDSANLSKIWSLRLLLSPIVNSELPGCPHHCLQQCSINASWMMLSETLTSATPTNSFSNLLTIRIFGYENISQLKFSKLSNFINF